MDKLMLVGGNGFIGRTIIEQLHDQYQIVVLTRNPDADFFKESGVRYLQYDGFDTPSELLKQIMRTETPDYILNLASVVTAERDLALLSQMVEVDFKLLLSIYDAAKDLKSLKLFVQFGSAEEYGNIAPPFRETDREYPNSPYALSKQLATNTAIMLRANFDFPVTVLRLGNVFGKYQPSGKFIPYVIEKLHTNSDIEMTLGEQKRDFIYAPVVVAILHELIKRHDKINGEIINVASGESHSLKDIVEFCRTSIGSSSKVIYGKYPYRENEMMDFCCDTSKLSRLTSHFGKIDFYKDLTTHIKQTLGDGHEISG